VRYCGWYGNRSRGMRKLREEPEDDLTREPEVEEVQADPDLEFRDRIKSAN